MMHVFKYTEEQAGFLLPGLPITPKTPHNHGGSANSCQTSYHYKNFPGLRQRCLTLSQSPLQVTEIPPWTWKSKVRKPIYTQADN